MPERREILKLWRQAQSLGEEVCLATVVRTEGSSYRKPGARMLLTRGGQRAGTISGGCLEAEIQKQAWWLCRNSPVVERYCSSFDPHSDDTDADHRDAGEVDPDIPYGLACGGTVWVLLERGSRAVRVLNAIADCVEQRIDIAFACSLEDRAPTGLGTQVILRRDGRAFAGAETEFVPLAQQALDTRTSHCLESARGMVFAEYMAPPQRLFVFGAGDDAQPVVQFAHTLGWQVVVVDGRSHLATPARFPLAHAVHLASGEAALADLNIDARDAVIVMTHSYRQDRAALHHVLLLEPAYLGVLGPRHRTEWLMGALEPARGWKDRVHTPAGLDLGAEGPAAIALSIVAEIEATLARSAKDRRRSAAALSEMLVS